MNGASARPVAIPVGVDGVAPGEAGGAACVAVPEKGTGVALRIEDDGSARSPALHAEFAHAQARISTAAECAIRNAIRAVPHDGTPPRDATGRA